MEYHSLFWQRLCRYAKHQWLSDQVSRALDAEAMSQLTAAVERSEQRHSGQVRICIEGGLPTSYLFRDATPRERAVALFGKLRVWDTEDNNGVLIYLLLADRAIEIVADRGLVNNVSNEAWEAIMSSMQGALRAGLHQQALEHAINHVSILLEKYYSSSKQGPNELPDTPAVGPFR